VNTAPVLPGRMDFGRWGGRVELFDFFHAWRQERLAIIEAGINPRTGQPIEDLQVFEASPDAKADFATFLWEPVTGNFYGGYERVESQWSRFVGIESVSSFDEVRIKGANGLTGIGYVGELGEYPGLRRTFRPEAAIVVDTYGGVYSMTRKLLRSRGVEQLVARTPGDMGEEMADFISKLIIGLILANPDAPDGLPMYSTARGNSVAVPLSEDSFVDAAVWLRTRKDPDGRSIRTQMRSAVVQNDRWALRLRQIVDSQLAGHVQNDPATGSMTRGTSNPIAGSGILPADGVLIEPDFPDANDVHFFSDPDRLPAFIAAFLDGQRQPMIGMADPTVMHLSNSNASGQDMYSYEGDTVDYKTRHDVGATAVEPLGTYRLTPA
jgi:hypothetical protein